MSRNTFVYCDFCGGFHTEHTAEDHIAIVQLKPPSRAAMEWLADLRSTNGKFFYPKYLYPLRHALSLEVHGYIKIKRKEFPSWWAYPSSTTYKWPVPPRRRSHA